MTFSRLIYHYSSDMLTLKGMLNQQAVTGCWFELLRRGGCGSGELRLQTSFAERDIYEIGDWIAFEPQLGKRWYLGRIDERICESPAGITLSLQGMSIELNERFAGGFDASADGADPLKFGESDLFSLDPDRDRESYIVQSNPREIIKWLLDRYVVGNSHITYELSDLENPPSDINLKSAKFRGEESLRSIIKDLALRAGDMSWGVDHEGKFFLKKQPIIPTTTFQECVNLTSLSERRDYQMIFNRVTLTGDYVYDIQDHSGDIARRSYRWRGNYLQPESQQQYGDRRLRLWIPWIRTATDAQQFMDQFFKIYADGNSIYSLETAPVNDLSFPWLGPVRLLDINGEELITGVVEKIRVEFDHAVILKMDIGPQDPRELWSEPQHDERWELPEGLPSGYGGDIITDRNQNSSSENSSSSLFSSEETTEITSDIFTWLTSDETSEITSSITSEETSEVTSELTSEITSELTSENNSEETILSQPETSQTTSDATTNITSNPTFDNSTTYDSGPTTDLTTLITTEFTSNSWFTSETYYTSTFSSESTSQTSS